MERNGSSLTVGPVPATVQACRGADSNTRWIGCECTTAASADAARRSAARDGVLPGWLGGSSSNPTGSAVSSGFVSILSALVIVGARFFGAESVEWSAYPYYLGFLGIVALMCVTSLAAVGYFGQIIEVRRPVAAGRYRRELVAHYSDGESSGVWGLRVEHRWVLLARLFVRRGGADRPPSLVALLAAASLGWVAFTLVTNDSSRPILVWPWLLPAIVGAVTVVGLLWGLILRATQPTVYQGIGR